MHSVLIELSKAPIWHIEQVRSLRSYLLSPLVDVTSYETVIKLCSQKLMNVFRLWGVHRDLELQREVTQILQLMKRKVHALLAGFNAARMFERFEQTFNQHTHQQLQADSESQPLHDLKLTAQEQIWKKRFLEELPIQKTDPNTLLSEGWDRLISEHKRIKADRDRDSLAPMYTEAERQFIDSIETQRHMRRDCLGCAPFFYQQTNLLDPLINSTRVVAIPTAELFKETDDAAKMVCALLNDQGGILLVGCTYSDDNALYAQGMSLSKRERQKLKKAMDWEIHPRDFCRIEHDFVPIAKNPKQSTGFEYSGLFVLRIKAHVIRPEYLFCLSSNKRERVHVFGPEGQLQEIEPEEMSQELKRALFTFVGRDFCDNWTVKDKPYRHISQNCLPADVLPDKEDPIEESEPPEEKRTFMSLIVINKNLRKDIEEIMKIENIHIEARSVELDHFKKASTTMVILHSVRFEKIKRIFEKYGQLFMEKNKCKPILISTTLFLSIEGMTEPQVREFYSNYYNYCNETFQPSYYPDGKICMAFKNLANAIVAYFMLFEYEFKPRFGRNPETQPSKSSPVKQSKQFQSQQAQLSQYSNSYVSYVDPNTSPQYLMWYASLTPEQQQQEYLRRLSMPSYASMDQLMGSSAFSNMSLYKEG